MAPAGSGQSRRSHTKSRKGCKTCKRRHIRCDEQFPQCRNCTKHQVRCDYMDSPPVDEQLSNTPPVPDLFWSPEVESIINHWERVGEASLGDFSIDLHAEGHQYTRSDLHLMYYSLSSGQSAETREFTVWTATTAQVLMFARTYPFLVHAMLGFVAQFLAWEKNSPDAKNLAYHHGGIALQGLQDAIGKFSKTNSDAVLLASILLSWQANDWRSYASLQAGIRTVMKSMQHWKAESSIPHIIEEQQMSCSLHPHTPSHQSQSEEFKEMYTSTLQSLHSAFENLQNYLENRPDEVRWIEQCKDYFQRLLGVNPAETLEEQFNHLYSFRKWLFWIPPTLLKSESRDPLSLVVIAYIFAAAQQLECLFPDVAPSFCSMMTVRPIDEIFRAFETLQQSPMANTTQLNNMLYLMQYPRQVASTYQGNLSQRELSRIQNASPPAPLDLVSTQLGNTLELFDYRNHHSPMFMPAPASQHTPSEVSSSHGSPYLGLPGPQGRFPNSGDFSPPHHELTFHYDSDMAASNPQFSSPTTYAGMLAQTSDIGYATGSEGSPIPEGHSSMYLGMPPASVADSSSQQQTTTGGHVYQNHPPVTSHPGSNPNTTYYDQQ